MNFWDYSFRVALFGSLLLSVTCCNGIFRQGGYGSTASDSIVILLDMGKLQPDEMSQEAADYLYRALELILQKSPKKNIIFEIYYNLGKRSQYTGNLDLALSYFNEALKYSGKKNLALTGNVHNHIGQIAVQQGKFDLAMEHFPKAMSIRIQLDDIEGQASSYRNIGTAYHKSKYYELAQTQYELSLDIYVSNSNEIGIADCYNNLGALWLDLNEHRRALEYFLKSEEIYLKNNVSAQLWSVYFNIGHTYFLLHEQERALTYFGKMQALSEVLASPVKLAESFRIMGAFYYDLEVMDSAMYYYSKAIDIAQQHSLHEILHDALDWRSRLHVRYGRYGEALVDQINHCEAFNAINNIETAKAFVQKSEQYQYYMLQQEQLYRYRIQQAFIIGLSAILVLVAAMGIEARRGYLQKKKANVLLTRQKEEITDSLRYASMIQKATLPAKEYSESVLPEHFIYYKPRDIVSGDFYWIDRKEEYIIVAAADCTGHGVPGAIVSMLGISTLTKIAGKMKIPKADEILNELRNEIIRLLNPVGSVDTRQDGMDIALTIINTKKQEIEYAGAFNPLYIIRNGELIEKKADRMPIGLFTKREDPFTACCFKYLPGDTIYLFSDGYYDQFGGEKDSKFKTKNFKDLLININRCSMDEQAKIIDKTHLEWRGETPQIDDILVVGIKLE